MAKKKRGKKARPKASRKVAVVPKRKVSAKIKKTLIATIITLILSIACWIIYNSFFVGNEFFGNLFFVLAYIAGFLSLAFFIALLVLLVLKAFKK